MRRILILNLILASSFGLSGCIQHEEPNYTYMPDMHYSPANKAQESQELNHGKGMRTPPEGTVPRGFDPYHYSDADTAGKWLKNTHEMTRANLYKGQAKYNIYCNVCHGNSGLGEGSVVPPFPRPPNLTRDEISKWPDGKLYHIITKGQNIMPGYASQIKPDDRWFIVQYLRVLHRAKNPSDADLEALKQ